MDVNVSQQTALLFAKGIETGLKGKWFQIAFNQMCQQLQKHQWILAVRDVTLHESNAA